MKRSELIKIIKEEISKTLKERTPAPAQNAGKLSDFYQKQIKAFQNEGYEEVPGFAAAGIKQGSEIIQDGSQYSGYVITFKFKGIDGKFIAFTERGIRGVVRLHGPWTVDQGEANNWTSTLGGKEIGIGYRNPKPTDDDLMFATIKSGAPLLYKKGN